MDGGLRDERLTIGTERSPRAGERPSLRRVERRGILGAERLDDRLVGDRAPVHAPALHHPRADAPDDQPPDALARRSHRSATRQPPSSSPRGRPPVRPRRLEQDAEIARHALLAVAVGVVWLLRAPVAPGVGCDHLPAGGDERVHHARARPSWRRHWRRSRGGAPPAATCSPPPPSPGRRAVGHPRWLEALRSLYR